ncbi:MAG: MBOAT family O-acyltransferase [Silvibacterium sp.]
MLFNSPEFLFCYLPIVLAGFAVAGRFGRLPVVCWLAFMSLVFYGYWRPAFLFLLVGSIIVNFTCSRLIWKFQARPAIQKACLVAGVSLNLGALFYYKYLFSLLHFLDGVGVLHHSFGNVILPLGISFFTFTQIAYLIDLAQGAAEPQSFISYVLFVTFFPHLIAGPILHHGEIMPQFAKGRDFSLKWNDVALGLSWFILGLCKKVLIADRIARFADSTFAQPAGLPLLSAWLGVLNYAVQLYFDFSGYSDMALGLARMFSIELPFNFNSPYKSPSVIEFWQRWHMTLSRYLTVYLYNPMSLSISRRRLIKGKPTSRKATRTLAGFSSMVALPTIATMFLAGIWHGAGLQFIIFGVLHGVYLTMNHAWRIFRREGTVVAKIIEWRPVSVLLTFFAVCIAAVFFRAASTHDALRLLAGMFGANGLGLPAPVIAKLGTALPGLLHVPFLAAPMLLLSGKAFLVLALFPVVWFLPNTQEILGQAKGEHSDITGFTKIALWRPNLAWATSLGMVMIAVLWYMTDTSSFLYFQF